MKHEANEARHRRADEQRIDERDVIGNQQRRSASGNVFLADDADTIERMGKEP